jgi:basic membrane protein A and related proteins
MSATAPPQPSRLGGRPIRVPRRRRLSACALAASALLLIAACSSTSSNSPTSSSSAAATGSTSALSAVLVSVQPVNDQGVMQSFVSGFHSAAQTYHYNSVRIIVLSDPSTYVSTLQTVASRYGVVIATFPPMIQAVSTVAPNFPKTHFVLLDAQLPKPLANVQTLFFFENQSSFLSGVVAGLMTKTDKVGFLGGVVQDVINRYLIGFYFGVKYVNPKARVCWSYVGNLESPTLGDQDALALYNKGVDILHAATAGTETGVYQASEQVRKYMIGADVSILPLDPSYGLTASGPDFAGAAEVVLKQQATGTFAAGLHQYGLKDGAVRILPFSAKVPAAVQAKVAAVQSMIISGKLAVPGDNGVIPPGMVNC